jgi:pSer/pThr/pTyr-binding forkhead associated (FHA) protein
MSRLILKLSQGRIHQLVLKEGEYRIGRGTDCEIMLPNVSVSREHARLVVGFDSVRVIDQDSQNGIFLNGERVTNVKLSSNDEIGIGRFSLVFLGDEPEDRFYQGRAVTYIPRYDSAMLAATDTTGTFALSAADLKRVQHIQNTIEKARFVLESDSSRSWVPGEQILSFGPSGKVSLPGMGSFGGVVAEAYWNGWTHVLESKARLTSTKVNGLKISTKELSTGDRLRIGKVGFIYQAPRKV